MKKVLIAVLAVVVIGIVIWGVTNVKRPQEAVIADILPQDVAFFYSIQNIEDIWKDIKTSRFWREFSNIKLWADIQVASGLNDLKSQFKDNVGIDLSEENLMNLVGKELTIAVSPGASENDPPKIVLLCLGKNSKALENITGAIIDKVKVDDPTRVIESQYGGKTIKQIKSISTDQPDIYVLLLDNILIVGLGDTVSNLQQIIDISSGKNKQSLANGDDFKKISNLIGSKNNLAGLFYMDFVKMRKYLQGLQIPGAAAAAGAAGQTTAGLDMLNFMGGWTEIKNGLTTKLYLYPNTEAMDEQTKKIWEAAPKVPETLKFVPEKTLLYFIWSSIDLSSVWNLWQDNLKKQAPEQVQPILDALDTFQEDWNINLETDVFPVLGDEVSFVFSDLITEGIIPVPKLALALKVKDKNKTDKLIADIVEKNNQKAAEEDAAVEVTENVTEEAAVNEDGEEIVEETDDVTASLMPKFRIQLNLTEQTYDDHVMKIIQLPLVGVIGLSPGYTYIDDFLVIGINTKTLEEIIDVSKGKSGSISQNPEYNEIAKIMPKSTNQMSYINVAQLLDIGVGIANLISLQTSTLLQIPEPENADDADAVRQQKAQAEATIATINTNVIPLLKTLKAIKIIATAAVNNKDYIEQTLVLKIEDI